MAFLCRLPSKGVGFVPKRALCRKTSFVLNDGLCADCGLCAKNAFVPKTNFVLNDGLCAECGLCAKKAFVRKLTLC